MAKPALKRPCAECPWVLGDQFRFDGPVRVRHFIGRAIGGQHHQCHLNTRCMCRGSMIFAAKALDVSSESGDLSVAVYSRQQLIEAAYRLRREGRLTMASTPSRPE